MNEERTMWYGQTECDFCGQEISKTLYDGTTKGGGAMWATMCERCFLQHGNGVEWGVGQKYEQDEDGNFYLVAGGEQESFSMSEQ